MRLDMQSSPRLGGKIPRGGMDVIEKGPCAPPIRGTRFPDDKPTDQYE